jgi:hypothetical protein
MYSLASWLSRQVCVHIKLSFSDVFAIPSSLTAPTSSIFDDCNGVLLQLCKEPGIAGRILWISTNSLTQIGFLLLAVLSELS